MMMAHAGVLGKCGKSPSAHLTPCLSRTPGSNKKVLDVWSIMINAKRWTILELQKSSMGVSALPRLEHSALAFLLGPLPLFWIILFLKKNFF